MSAFKPASLEDVRVEIEAIKTRAADLSARLPRARGKELDDIERQMSELYQRHLALSEALGVSPP